MSRHRIPGNTLYVRNVSDRVRYDDLRRLFSKYGRLIDVTIPLDFRSGMPKGFCFVEYEDPRDAEEAQYRMHKQYLFGKEIDVEFAKGDRKTPGEMRTRFHETRGGGGGGGGGYRDRGFDPRGPPPRGDYYSRSRSRSGDRGRGYGSRGERDYRGSMRGERMPPSPSSHRHHHHHGHQSGEPKRSRRDIGGSSKSRGTVSYSRSRSRGSDVRNGVARPGSVSRRSRSRSIRSRTRSMASRSRSIGSRSRSGSYSKGGGGRQLRKSRSRSYSKGRSVSRSPTPVKYRKKSKSPKVEGRARSITP